MSSDRIPGPMPGLNILVQIGVQLAEILEGDGKVPPLQVLCCLAVAIGFGVSEDADDGWIAIAEWLDQKDLHPVPQFRPQPRR